MRPDLKSALLDLARNVAAAELPRFLAELREVELIGMQRLLAPVTEEKPPENGRLDVNEAAQRLGVSPAFLYKHHDQKPYSDFAEREGRKLLFDRRGLETYIRRQRARR